MAEACGRRWRRDGGDGVSWRTHAVAATPRRAQAQNMQRIILAVALFQSCSSFEPKSVYDGGWLNGLTESEAAKYTGYSY